MDRGRACGRCALAAPRRRSGHRRRRRLVRVRARLRPRGRGGGDARRRGRRGTRSLRTGAGRPAGHRDLRRRRRRARPARRHRGRRARRVRLQPLPRPGTVDAVADARLGRVRGGRRRAGAAPPPQDPARARLRRPRLRLQRAHGHLDVAELLSTHRRWADARRRQGSLVRRGARRRERRDRARRRAGAAPDARALRPASPRGGGVGFLAVAAAALALATPASFLQAHQGADGGFADAGGTADAALTSWAVLGLAAKGADTGRAEEFLRAHEDGLKTQTDLALAATAESVGGDTHLVDRLSTRPTQLTNAAIWTILAFRQAGRPAPKALVAAVRARQHASGGWAWLTGGKPDSNDTAAAIQALRSAGVSGAPIARGLAALRTFQNRDGGFELAHGRGSDAQSTAWAIQAPLAAGRRAPPAAYAYLALLRRPDGSYRYSARYAVTPVWVTAQVLPALAGKPFPLRY